MPEHVAHGMGFPGMVPVVVDVPEKHGANTLSARPLFVDEMRLQRSCSERVQVHVGSLNNRIPGRPHLIERRSASGLAGANQVAETGNRSVSLSE